MTPLNLLILRIVMLTVRRFSNLIREAADDDYGQEKCLCFMQHAWVQGQWCITDGLQAPG